MGKDIKLMLDENHDGLISQDEITLAKEVQDLKDKMKKSEDQSRMAWISLIAILVFTAFLFSPYVDVTRVDAISEFIGMFYITLAGVVAAYMGTQAWAMRKS